MPKSFLILAVCLSTLCFCTVQKRVYQRGFFVENHSKNKSAKGKTIQITQTHQDKTISTTVNKSEFINANSNDSQVASAGKGMFYLQAQKRGKENCDSLYLKDGTLIIAKVKEVGLKDIRYKLCDFQEGPDYLVEKLRASHIHYSNGKVEVFREEDRSPSPKTKKEETAAYRKGTENNANASTSLAFGILGIYPLILIGSIIGLIFGQIAKREMRQNPGRYSNEKIANAGFIISILGIFLWVGLIMLVFLI